MAKKTTKKAPKGAKKKTTPKAAPAAAPEQIDHAAQIDDIEAYLKGCNLGDDFASLIGGLIRDRFAVIASFSAAAEEAGESESDTEAVDGDAAEIVGDDAGDEPAGDGEADAPEADGDPEVEVEGEAEGGEEAEAEAEAETDGEVEGETEGEEEAAGDEPEAEAEEEVTEEPTPAKKGAGKKGKKAAAEPAADESTAPDWTTIGVTPAMEKAALAELNGDAKAAAKLAKELGFPLPKSMAGKKSSDAEKLAYAASVSAAYEKLTGEKMTVKALQALAKKLGIEVKTGRTKKEDAIKAKFAEALIGSVVAEL